jgi:hypothetical protein
MKKSFTFTLIFILVIAIFWFGFSIIVVTGHHPALPDSQLYQAIMAGLAFLTAVFLIIQFFLLKAKNKLAFFITIAFLTFLAILIFMDDFGISDLLILTITIIPIVLLFKDRNWYFQSQTRS